MYRQPSTPLIAYAAIRRCEAAVATHLALADLDEQRRQPAQVGIQRRKPGVRQRRAARVRVREELREVLRQVVDEPELVPPATSVWLVLGVVATARMSQRWVHPSPGADVAAVGPVTVHMWQR